MSLHLRRIGAMFRKELSDYRRSGQMIVTMAFLPLIFLNQPLVVIFKVPASTALEISQAPVLLYMLAIPALTPGMVAAYSVVGERLQGTLEPVLTTPISREELLLGKALATLVPSVAISYAVFAFFVVFVELFAQPGIASALIRGPELLAQLVFTPLLAGCSIWIGIAISTRSNDLRTAQSFSLLAAVPFGRAHDAHRVQGDTGDARLCPGSRGAASRPRRARLARDLGDVRSRTAHHRHQVILRSALLTACSTRRRRLGSSLRSLSTWRIR